jgi:hypothetical protein
MERYGAKKSGDYWYLPASPDSLFQVAPCGCLTWKDGLNAAVEDALMAASLEYIKGRHADVIAILGESFEVVYEHRHTYLDWTYGRNWLTIVHERFGPECTHWVNGRQINHRD